MTRTRTILTLGIVFGWLTVSALAATPDPTQPGYNGRDCGKVFVAKSRRPVV